MTELMSNLQSMIPAKLSKEAMEAFSKTVETVGETANTSINRRSDNYIKLLDTEFKKFEIYGELAKIGLGTANKVVEILMESYANAMNSGESLEIFLREMAINPNESEHMRKFVIEKEIESKKNRTSSMEKMLGIVGSVTVVILGIVGAVKGHENHINRPWYR